MVVSVAVLLDKSSWALPLTSLLPPAPYPPFSVYLHFYTKHLNRDVYSSTPGKHSERKIGLFINIVYCIVSRMAPENTLQWLFQLVLTIGVLYRSFKATLHKRNQWCVKILDVSLCFVLFFSPPNTGRILLKLKI